MTTYAVRRWTGVSRISSVLLLVLVLVLVAVPYGMSGYVVQQLTSLFILVILAAMWNTLAGYGGLVSVGQQAYIGIGAYATVLLTREQITPYLAMVLAAVIAAVIALPTSLLVLRLHGGQFAIGTWVVAETFALLVTLNQTLGGGTGTSLLGLNQYDPDYRRAYTYWLALAFTVLMLGIVFVLLRSRTGPALQAIRDDEEAAGSLGVRVLPAKRLLFVIAAFGCGAAGALTVANSLYIQPQSIFGVQWTAYMIFMVLVGGIGTFEGPLIGAIVFFVVQNLFADYGAWYLIGLGAVAILFALVLPRGLWGIARVQLLPLGHRLVRK
ncbi:branched-chain amino acid ABC transporter permease [Amycolatopsis sp.]|uniref:branched-chain amino acid ABC transporter permease n=1 Tax=Amycolatopsis sp. TaxID=37632 RepID=UPI002C9359C9|nr:branched-chain amino acid ABC transporter permease [Amycolatopsis sp.]HVV10144.1 branched-chain amino acid ABC transporter permease [Amycolatopsis sp.]